MIIMKRINKLFLFLFWVVCLWSFSFADVIPEYSHSFSKCVKIENIDSVPWYKLVIHVQTDPGEDYFYEVSEWVCLPHHYKFGTATPMLLKSNTDIELLNQEIEQDKDYMENFFWTEILWDFAPINVNWWYVSDLSNKTYENNTYRLVQNDNKYELELISTETDEIPAISANWATKIQLKKIQTHNSYLIKFFQSRLLTIFIETVVLFLLCKLFLKEYNLKNWKIILTWILASTITLPILWFILPLFIHEWTVFVIFGELFVTFVEVVIIKYLLNIKRSNAILLSIICNLFSFLIWLLI